jgi:hypothetical protein
MTRMARVKKTLSSDSRRAADPARPPALSTARTIDLEPEDWVWATWRPRTPLPRPEPAPFDLEDCLERFARVKRENAFREFHWSKARLAPIMTREEAHFWIVAMTEVKRRNVAPVLLVDQLRAMSKTFGEAITLENALERVRAAAQHVPQELLVFLVHLFSPRDWIAVARAARSLEWYTLTIVNHQVLDGFRRYVLPYLPDEDYQVMRDELRGMLAAPALPPNYDTDFPFESYLAAALGLHEETRRIVGSIPDEYYPAGQRYYDYCQQPQLLVLGLGDPQLVESEMRRLKLLLQTPDHVRGWIAHTEDSALDLVRDSILAASLKEQAVALLEVLALVKSPRTAPVMLELMLESKAPATARRWLDEQPGHAIPGLIPVAAGRGKAAEAALDYLRAQSRKGHDDFLRENLAAAPPEEAAKVRREVMERAEASIPALDAETTPAWLRTACNEVQTLKPPSWVTPEDLPPILVDGRKLNEVQGQAVFATLAKSPLRSPQALIAALKAHADRRALDAFAWALFQRWLAEGAPAKEKWAMAALGLLGSDDAALKLTPLIRAWPGESQHARAVFGLECLRAIGSDAALMQLNSIAQKLPFKGLKAKAAEMMEAIAKDRSLSRAELEDRIVPDCGLDERGSRVFDFGPRQFHFALGPELKPMVRDEPGKLKADLPRPGVKDDPARAAAAVDDWKRLKKQVREVARVQAERLERAMISGRRWSPADFETLLVRHPLMIHLARLLLWGNYEQAGKLAAAFRVTEEHDYADVNESAYKLEGITRVGVVHPLHLSDEDRSAWGEIFTDYALIPPFPQLGRKVHRLEPSEEHARELLRNRGIKIPAVTLVGILERHGWNRGIPQDAGTFHEHAKPFEGANVTAIIEYDGIPMDDMTDWDDQEVQRCYFVPGLDTPRMYARYEAALPLGEVDPVVVSEVLGTLGALASKGK